MPDRQLSQGRKRRLLAALDKALAARGIKRKAPKLKANPETERRRQQAAERSKTARRSYGELAAAVKRLGGIRANRDYKRGEIPRELYNARGLAPDEMAQLLSSEGFHYDGDTALFTDLDRRRESVTTAREGSRKRKNPSTVCSDVKRDKRGRFARQR